MNKAKRVLSLFEGKANTKIVLKPGSKLTSDELNDIMTRFKGKVTKKEAEVIEFTTRRVGRNWLDLQDEIQKDYPQIKSILGIVYDQDFN